MTVKGILISLALMSGLLMGLAMYSTSVYDNYNVNYTGYRLEHLSVASEVNQTMKEMKTAVEQAQVTGTAWDILFMLSAGIYNAVKIMFNLVNIFARLPADVVKIVGITIPDWVSSVLIMVVTIIVIFAIIKSVTRVEL